MSNKGIQLPEHIDSDMFTVFRKLEHNEFIIFFLDTAGEGSDFNAGQGLSKTRLDVPIVLHYQGSVVDVTPKLKTFLEWVSEVTGVAPCVAYELNNGGGYELARLDRLNTNAKFSIYRQYKLSAEGKPVRTDKMGWNTDSATRPQMLKGIQDLVNNHLVQIYDPNTVDEMFSFVKRVTSGGWRAEADTGSHDDLIMALAGAWQLYQTEEAPANNWDNEVTAPSWVKNSMGIR